MSKNYIRGSKSYRINSTNFMAFLQRLSHGDRRIELYDDEDAASWNSDEITEIFRGASTACAISNVEFMFSSMKVNIC